MYAILYTYDKRKKMVPIRNESGKVQTYPSKERARWAALEGRRFARRRIYFRVVDLKEMMIHG